MNPVYTIIIPHYNSVRLLCRLLNTVPKREDLQIIVVDDCSPHQDELNTIKEQFPYVEWLTTENNSGGGKARNLGLKHSKGKWIFFADADDFFTPLLNEVLDQYKDVNEYDMVFFNALSVDSCTYHLTGRTYNLNKWIQLDKGTSSNTSLRYLFGEPWCKFIKRNIIFDNNILFDEISVHNDTCFSYMCGFHAQKTVVDNRMLYCVTDRANSVSKPLSKEKILIRSRVFALKNRFLKEKNIQIFDPILLSVIPLSKRYDDKNLRIEVKNIIKNNGFSSLDITVQTIRDIVRRAIAKFSRIIKM